MERRDEEREVGREGGRLGGRERERGEKREGEREQGPVSISSSLHPEVMCRFPSHPLQ